MNPEEIKYEIIEKIAKAQDYIGVEMSHRINDEVFGGGYLLDKTIFRLNQMLEFMRFYYKMKGDRKTNDK